MKNIKNKVKKLIKKGKSNLTTRTIVAVQLVVFSFIIISISMIFYIDILTIIGLMFLVIGPLVWLIITKK